MLPGRAYPCEMSLLAWTTRALQAAGWAVLQAAWELTGVPDAPRAFVEEAARRLDDTERPSGPVLVVAKSLGTLTAHWAAERAYSAVWLTPILEAFGRYPMPVEGGELHERLRTYPVESLVVGGTADGLWRAGFRGTGRVMELEGADHRLEYPDWRRSLRQHEEVAAAVVDFAEALR